MFRFLARWFGYWLIAGSLIIAVIDGTRSIASTRLEYTSLFDAWIFVSNETFEQAKAFILGLGWPVLWDPLLTTALLTPAALVLFLSGLICVALGTRPADPFAHH